MPTPYSNPDPATFDAIHALLEHVMRPMPPPPVRTIGAWRAYDRAIVRSWAERELVRLTFGRRGNPAVATPFVIRMYTETIKQPTIGL